MGRSQRHKAIYQGIASNGEIISEGGANPEVLAALFEAVGEGAQEAAPILTELQPNTAALGDPDFTLSCIGDNFNSNSKIIWNGMEEPTTLVGPTEVTTIVKPSTANVTGPLPVLIRAEIRGVHLDSQPQTFTFTEPLPPETVAGSRGRE